MYVLHLEKLYFQAQRVFHPDRLVGKGPMERQQAVLQSMLINEAYDALKQPLERAKHLLLLDGITVGSEQDSVKPSTTLLMEIMGQREALAETKTSEDVALLEAKQIKNKQETMVSLSTAFQGSDLTRAAEFTIRLGYLTKLDDEIRIRKKGLAA